MTRRFSHIVEPLESRTLLAVTGPHTISVSVFNDLNRNGLRNSNEPGMPNWGVIALDLRDSAGTPTRSGGRTDSAGQISFSDFTLDFEVPSARIYIEPNKRYYCTTHQQASSGWFGVASPAIAVGLTDVAPISGLLLNSYQRADGAIVTTPLAARRVYEDANLNRRYDISEKFGVTDLEGRYTISLRTGTHTLRAELSGDWTAAAGQKLVRSAVVYPYQDFPTITAAMENPTVIDVLAAYTPAAGTVLAGGADRLNDYFRQTNRVYANSDTNVLINLAGFKRTLYTESGEIDRDLTRLQKRGDGFLEDVHAERERIDADLSVLLTARDANDGDVVGLAYEYQDAPGNDAFGFSVVAIDSSENGDTLAHELGHNLGAGHDAATAAENDDDPVRPYAHGYRFTAGDPKRTYKDIMAYGPGVMLPFFSTPLFKHLGKPMGNSASADNARVIAEVAADVSRYR